MCQSRHFALPLGLGGSDCILNLSNLPKEVFLDQAAEIRANRAAAMIYRRKEISKAEAVRYFTEKGDEYKLDLLENLQDVLGEGPCRDAFDFGEPMQTGLDRHAASRWPQFIPAAFTRNSPVIWTKAR